MTPRFLLINVFVTALHLTTFAQSETHGDCLTTILNPVNNPNLTTLYVGVNNRIAISAPGVKPENLQVKLSGSTSVDALEGGNGLYIARVFFVGETLIEIYTKENGIEKKLAEKILQTRVLPGPKSEKFKEVINSLGLKVVDTVNN